jgi:hypothetical protein
MPAGSIRWSELDSQLRNTAGNRIEVGPEGDGSRQTPKALDWWMIYGTVGESALAVDRHRTARSKRSRSPRKFPLGGHSRGRVEVAVAAGPRNWSASGRPFA